MDKRHSEAPKVIINIVEAKTFESQQMVLPIYILLQ